MSLETYERRIKNSASEIREILRPEYNESSYKILTHLIEILETVDEMVKFKCMKTDMHGKTLPLGWDDSDDDADAPDIDNFPYDGGKKYRRHHKKGGKKTRKSGRKGKKGKKTYRKK